METDGIHERNTESGDKATGHGYKVKLSISRIPRIEYWLHSFTVGRYLKPRQAGGDGGGVTFRGEDVYIFRFRAALRKLLGCL